MADQPGSDNCRVWLDAYGTHLPHWPAEARSRATAAFTDPACHAVWDEALALDATLDHWSLPPPSAALIARIEATAPRPARKRLLWSLLAAIAALSGAAVGSVAAASITPPSVHANDATNTAFGHFGEENK